VEFIARRDTKAAMRFRSIQVRTSKDRHRRDGHPPSARSLEGGEVHVSVRGSSRRRCWDPRDGLSPVGSRSWLTPLTMWRLMTLIAGCANASARVGQPSACCCAQTDGAVSSAVVPEGEPQSARRRLDPMACASMIDIVPQGILKW